MNGLMDNWILGLLGREQVSGFAHLSINPTLH
jgi:hypothetical protein